MSVACGKRTSVVLVEFGGHAMHLYSLAANLSREAEVSVVLRVRLGQENWFPSRLFEGFEIRGINATRARFLPSMSFYLELVKSFRKADVVWIATGPEQKVGPDIAVFMSLLFSLRKRFVLNVRNPIRWLIPRGKGTFSLSTFFRRIALSRISAFTFESHSSMEYFLGRSNFYAPMYVIPALLPPPDLEAAGDLGLVVRPREEITIGLLGAHDDRRRNYREFIAALNELKKLTDVPLRVVILSDSSKVPEALKRSITALATVSGSTSLLDPMTFFELAAECAVLVAPLSDSESYGTERSSGAFGDAFAVNRPLVLPKHVEVELPWDDLVAFYTSPESLAQEILKFSRLKKPRPKFHPQYTVVRAHLGEIIQSFAQ